jgi:hypothetical protein
MTLLNLWLAILIIINYQSCHISEKNNNEKSNLLVKQLSYSKTDLRIQHKPSKVNEIPTPKGFYREKTDSLSFGYYLRNLALDTVDNTIYSYNGSVISEGGYHHSIIKMDIGDKDLQQCADAVMRLRGEYLFYRKLYSQIHFNFLSDGKPRYFEDYSKGDHNYKTFRKYMDYIFTYANTSSLIKELKLVSQISDMEIGDVLIQKGNPIGHAVIIIDMAKEETTGKKIFMVAQSYMPAQSIHILSNLHDQDMDPWYPLDFDDPLSIPSWTFYKNDLRRFK